MYFMLLAGSHEERTPKREPGKEKLHAERFTAGDVVPSEIGLESLFGLNKFKRLPDRQGKRLFEQQQKEKQEKLRLAAEKAEAEQQAKLSQQAEDRRKPAHPLFSK